MAITTRDWWMLGIGAGVSFFIFSTLGREIMMTAMGVGKAEVRRALAKVEQKSEERAKPQETLFS